MVFGIYLALVLAIGLFGAAIILPFLLDIRDTIGIWLNVSTTAVYVLASLVVVMRLRALYRWR